MSECICDSVRAFRQDIDFHCPTHGYTVMRFAKNSPTPEEILGWIETHQFSMITWDGEPAYTTLSVYWPDRAKDDYRAATPTAAVTLAMRKEPK